MKKHFALFLAATVLLTGGCNRTLEETTPTSVPSTEEVTKVDRSQMFTNRDLDGSYDPSQCISVYLEGDTAVCDHPGVLLSGNTLTLQEEGTYLISGDWENGSIVVDMADTAKPQLVLSNASVSCEADAPLKILNADKVFVTLAEGTANMLTGGSEQAEGAVFSQQDLTFNGSGSLTVTAPTGHGIVCKDDLVFTGGSYLLNAASHGCDANDSVRIQNTTLTVEAGKDGIHCENDDPELGFVFAADCSVTIDAQGDGISAGRNLQIESGTYHITTGGGSENGTKDHSEGWGGFPGGGMGGRPGRPRVTENDTAAETDSTSIKGLKAATELLLLNGRFTLNTADDAIHAATVSIQGGSFQIKSGDDGIHADEVLTVTGGSVTVSESYEALEGLHIDISGGKLDLTATDDGINAAGGTDGSGEGGRDGMFGGKPGRPGGMGSASNGSITIRGGEVSVTASGDGLDANGTLAITGGQVTVTGPSQGDTATLDYDREGTISGGTFIGTGASGMAQSFSDSQQGVIACSVGQQSAETTITLTDAQGNVLLCHTPTLPYQVVILSCPQIQKGNSYTLTVGTISGEVEAA